MTWGQTLLIALLTGAAGAGTAGYVATLCVDWYRVSPREGGAGFLVFFIGIAGFIAGLVLGVVTARLVAGGFWIGLGWSVAIVAALGLTGAVAGRAFADVPPQIDGQLLMAEVEIRMPAGWTPAAEIQQQSSCDIPISADEFASGHVEWRRASTMDGRWIVPCDANIDSSKGHLAMRVRLGPSDRFEIPLGLPSRPTSEQVRWSDWTPMADATRACRVRVKPRNDWLREHDLEMRVQGEEASRPTLPGSAPVEAWLPRFEDLLTGAPVADMLAGAPADGLAAVQGRPLDLIPALRSGDEDRVRRAVYAAATLPAIPAELVGPLGGAGQLTVELIRRALASQTLDLSAEEAPLLFFLKWDAVMRRAGDATASTRKVVAQAAIDKLKEPLPAGDLRQLRAVLTGSIRPNR